MWPKPFEKVGFRPIEYIYTGTIALEERPPKLPIYCFRCADDPNHSTLRSAKAGDRHLTGYYLVATAAANARLAGGPDMWWREKHHYLSEIHSRIVMVLNPKFTQL